MSDHRLRLISDFVLIQKRQRRSPRMTKKEAARTMAMTEPMDTELPLLDDTSAGLVLDGIAEVAVDNVGEPLEDETAGTTTVTTSTTVETCPFEEITEVRSEVVVMEDEGGGFSDVGGGEDGWLEEDDGGVDVSEVGMVDGDDVDDGTEEVSDDRDDDDCDCWDDGGSDTEDVGGGSVLAVEPPSCLRCNTSAGRGAASTSAPPTFTGAAAAAAADTGVVPDELSVPSSSESSSTSTGRPPRRGSGVHAAKVGGGCAAKGHGLSHICGRPPPEGRRGGGVLACLHAC
ncbi:hypothetical protein DFJ73DRAFT_844424 [Zopfochytrium polystomum]|nr:hypothetical protein DFJ73DRAFT_844424 [Zopfochytrium polystomum]